ncbi:MAG: endolytic transglycosylase MltG, partial [Bacteroidales bacterium]|nr:endolytic transglycosylase MltG [Bacteroidales bacterium]
MKKLTVTLAVLAILAIGALLGWNWLQDNKLPNFRQQAEIYVYPEATADQVLDEIADKAQVRNRASLERCFKAKQVAQYLTPGHYTVTPGDASVYVARMLNNGWQTPVRLSLTGNLRVRSNIAAKIASQLLLDSATVHQALNDDRLLAEYGFTPRNVFSLLTPDTFDIYWTASMADLYAKQKAAWDAYWTEERDAKAKHIRLSRQQVSVLASIVTAESNNEAEMPKIAGVYLNRLKIGMPLQADPTVAFCFDYEPNRILRKHTQVDSPFNTYRYAGLPPAPIQVPTKACLNAVLNPAIHQYLYFCASPDFNGSHRFARSYSEHLANAREFQRALTVRLKNQ